MRLCKMMEIYSMDKKLQDKLYQKYPEIFKQKDYSIKESCMPWGIETNKGWYPLIEALCGSLQWDTDHNDYPQIVFTQVKEKYGTLRAYYTWAESKKEYPQEKYATQEGKIRFAENLSATICEECGSMADVLQTSGWICTLCPPCMKAYKKERNLK